MRRFAIIDNLAAATAPQQGWDLIYSDRGSARLQSPRGGGGVPYPRIDYESRFCYFFVLFFSGVFHNIP